jgi:hypothetical protein
LTNTDPPLRSSITISTSRQNAARETYAIEDSISIWPDRTVTKKTVLTENEALELSIPRDRRGSLEPQLIAKYQRRFPDFDDKIISTYARGMRVRGIQGAFA